MIDVRDHNVSGWDGGGEAPVCLKAFIATVWKARVRIVRSGDETQDIQHAGKHSTELNMQPLFVCFERKSHVQAALR